MAEAVARVLESRGVLLVEAGTGTGKTLAYLAAAAQTDQCIVISTGTKNLQDQLFESDIPLLERTLGRQLSAVCLKGLGNYLCRRKLEALLGASQLLSSKENAQLDRIQAWASTTESGDRAELSEIPEDAPIWPQVCSHPDTRVGPKCVFHESCFVTRARRAAQDARIVVVNHHLFFADLALRNGAAAILPAYDAVIFDEAHQIDEIATAFFGYRVSSRQVEDLARDVRRALKTAGFPDADSLLEKVAQSSKTFFSSILAGGAREPGRMRLLPEELSGEPETHYWRLDSDLEALSAHLGGLPALDDTVVACGRRTESLRADLGEILGQQHAASVYWKERGPRSTAIGASPIDVGDVLRENVFYQVETVVLTSATLTADGKFTYIKDRLGLDFEVGELILPSPFDYAEQVALYLPKAAPDPRHAGYVERLAALLVETAETVERGTLALFTSYRDMEQVAALVRPELERLVRVQGERPRQALLEELRNAREPMVLLATASFWEGVDVPGDALQLVAIARLPFASPGDPVVSARLRKLEEEGRKPFFEYQVPQACLALKQGFGRLIRSRRDRGIVALFDRRLQTMGYGKVFLRTLPSCAVVTDAAELNQWVETHLGTS